MKTNVETLSSAKVKTNVERVVLASSENFIELYCLKRAMEEVIYVYFLNVTLLVHCSRVCSE